MWYGNSILYISNKCRFTLSNKKKTHLHSLDIQYLILIYIVLRLASSRKYLKLKLWKTQQFYFY